LDVTCMSAQDSFNGDDGNNNNCRQYFFDIQKKIEILCENKAVKAEGHVRYG